MALTALGFARLASHRSLSAFGVVDETVVVVVVVVLLTEVVVLLTEVVVLEADWLGLNCSRGSGCATTALESPSTLRSACVSCRKRWLVLQQPRPACSAAAAIFYLFLVVCSSSRSSGGGSGVCSTLPQLLLLLLACFLGHLPRTQQQLYIFTGDESSRWPAAKEKNVAQPYGASAIPTSIKSSASL